MEDIDGGLHPAVDGQSLDEDDEDEDDDDDDDDDDDYYEREDRAQVCRYRGWRFTTRPTREEN